MTEREKMIALCKEAFLDAETATRLKSEHAENLADYLLANGVIIPPVKVGDIVYIEYKNKICPVTVYAIRIDTKTNNKRICVDDWIQLNNDIHHYAATFKWEKIGKSVFLTRESAEAFLSRKAK